MNNLEDGSMRKSHLLGMTYLILAALITPLDRLDAAVVYQYTGNNYTGFDPIVGNPYDSTMKVSGSFTANELLIAFQGDFRDVATSWTFKDGIYTFTETNSVA